MVLDRALAVVKSELTTLGEDRIRHLAPYAFVSHDDVKGVDQQGDDTLIAIKAPSGTTLEVPDPDHGMEAGIRRFQIYLTSSGGGMQIAVINDPDTPEQGEEEEGNPFEAGPGGLEREMDGETDEYFGLQTAGTSLCDLYELGDI